MEPNAFGVYVYLPSFNNLSIRDQKCSLENFPDHFYMCVANHFLWYECCDGRECCARIQPWLYVVLIGLFITIFAYLLTRVCRCLRQVVDDREEEDILFDKGHYVVHNPNYLKPSSAYSTFSRSGSLQKHSHSNGH